MRRWVALGGWEGAGRVLARLGLCQGPDAVPLPFDDIRSTFDGIIAFVEKGPLTVAEYLPIPVSDAPHFKHLWKNREMLYAPDPAGARTLLFRAQHTCFLHTDLNAAGAAAAAQERCDAWNALLHPSGQQVQRQQQQLVTFLRVVISDDPLEELQLVPRFHAAVRGSTQGRLPLRTVMVLLDESTAAAGQPSAVPLCALAEPVGPCLVWRAWRAAAATTLERDETKAAANAEAAGAPLAEPYHDSLQTVAMTMSRELRWKQLIGALPSLDDFLRYGEVTSNAAAQATTYARLGSLDGVSVFRGTCRGFGSTLTDTADACPYCSSRDGHAVEDTASHDTHEPWTDAQADELLLAYGMHSGDEVVASETVAADLRHGVHEVYVKLQELLGKSEDGVIDSAGNPPPS